ncbi:hypothetical protein PTSG_09811 [Salpingoeca rosetta]|uniref:MARVEL domain-containing protein n=1 Tax=Salpingoeca rosetta (strain ATCC 50818 / BSB-021) TaxID=946362 RepID=F2UP45_SALR5|nr:uncharacterized protein PTSG_09811 [Salpingoeca rosetta]EGD79400.1 hypothetical protein PTSG_09811 [Salpingoeca rosetta]|eukprot:XP_004989169.1 hypothetical protein PTSG_09811 [Salpingoeca rosetta]
MTAAQSFFLQPATILRMLEILCAIIVFGVIADNGKVGGSSIFNSNEDANGLGIAIGVMAFIAASLILAVGFISVTSSLFAQNQRVVSIAVFGLDAFFSLMWFITMIVLAAEWGKVNKSGSNKYVNAGNSAVAFSVFSWFLWMGSAFFSFRKMSEPEVETYDYMGQADPSPSVQYEQFPDQGDVPAPYEGAADVPPF